MELVATSSLKGEGNHTEMYVDVLRTTKVEVSKSQYVGHFPPITDLKMHAVYTIQFTDERFHA